MVESFRSQKESKETPQGFEMAPLPDNFYDLQRRITRKVDRKETESPYEKGTTRVVEGFEDVLHKPFGAGFFYNSPTSVYQLAFALSVSKHPVITKILEDETTEPLEAIKKFREEQVLSGLKIIDIGCGSPYFAVVAQKLGAEVYTTDVQDIPQQYEENIKKHIQLDLNRVDAEAVLKKETGGKFDIVSENIIGGVPDTRVMPPEQKKIISIGRVLLKKGGYLYHDPFLSDGILKKI